MNLPSVMNHNFSQVPRAEIPRSQFDRSHGYKTTLDAGYLCPIFIDEALPGDTFNLNMAHFARMATPLHPIMDNMYITTHFFSVPYRLVWDNWQKFNGEQRDPGDSTDFLIPQMTSTVDTGYAVGSIHDYMGLPTEVPGLAHSALWHRAYNLIWNEWFRDQNIQDSVEVPRGDGPDDPADYTLLRRGKRHDYFTSCLPWPQKGPSVELPLGASAPVIINPDRTTGQTPHWEGLSAGDPAPTGNANFWDNAGDTKLGTSLPNSAAMDPNGTLLADLTDATASTINALRQAFQIQKLYERDARGGTRYTEIIRAHFGVVSDDARLQRPEYLGGGESPINVHPVQQTSETTVDSPQGNLAAFGTSSGSGQGFTKSFTEHCLVIGLVSVRADLTYQQGLDRKWSRRTRFDHYWPALAHLGEQAVLRKEIWARGSLSGGEDDDIAFGYQEIWADYRYKNSQITGQFRSSYAQSLDTWHLSQEFGPTPPALSPSFIEENPPIERVIAVPSEPQFLLDTYFKFKCARPMPTYSVPGLVDHF